MTYPSNPPPPGNWKRAGAERHQTFRREIREKGSWFRLMSVRMTPASGRIERQRHLVAEMIKLGIGTFCL